MASDINAESDFTTFFEGLEIASLRRSQSLDTVAISAARKQDSTLREASPSDGFVQQADAVWHIAMPSGETAPRIGDIVLDSTGGCWTVLESKELPLLGRWKCETRNLSVSYGCIDRVDIERAVWGQVPRLSNGDMLLRRFP